MPVFKSDAEFEAYVTQQQADLVAEWGPAEPPARPPVAMIKLQRLLGIVVPLAVIVVLGIWYKNYITAPRQYTDTWDCILDSAAWVGGREYNANANTLTDRLTFVRPREQSEGR